ncbi:MAG: helix-turn-helix transcriptional regulator [Dolichospermum sp.]
MKCDKTREEIAQIIGENSTCEAANILGVHIRSVRNYKEKMKEGMSVKKPDKKWTKEEDEYLRSNAKNSTYSELQEDFKTLFKSELTRSQIGHRCRVLGTSPKKLRCYKNLTKKEQEICLTNSLSEAAEKLGVSIQTIKRRRKKLRGDLFDARTSVPLPIVSPSKSLITFSEQTQPWTSKDDELLIKRIIGNSTEEVALLFGKPREEIEERLQFLLKEEKAKISIDEILSQFQGMTAGQIHQLTLIYSYDPKSAVRYCEAIKEYKTKLHIHQELGATNETT